MDLQDNIFIAGHNGMVGSAKLKELTRRGYKNIITANKCDLNLIDSNKVSKLAFQKGVKTL